MGKEKVKPACRWCGWLHGVQCPAVRAIEFYPDGTVSRVVFKAMAEDFGADTDQVLRQMVGRVANPDLVVPGMQVRPDGLKIVDGNAGMGDLNLPKPVISLVPPERT
jgi:hypothetical protein